MTEKSKDHFHVTFSGRVDENQELEDVKQRLQRRFGIRDEDIEKMFSGRLVIVKKNVNERRARKIQKSFSRCGVFVDVVEYESKRDEGDSKLSPDANTERFDGEEKPLEPGPYEHQKSQTIPAEQPKLIEDNPTELPPIELLERVGDSHVRYERLLIATIAIVLISISSVLLYYKTEIGNEISNTAETIFGGPDVDSVQQLINSAKLKFVEKQFSTGIKMLNRAIKHNPDVKSDVINLVHAEIENHLSLPENIKPKDFIRLYEFVGSREPAKLDSLTNRVFAEALYNYAIGKKVSAMKGFELALSGGSLSTRQQNIARRLFEPHKRRTYLHVGSDFLFSKTIGNKFNQGDRGIEIKLKKVTISGEIISVLFEFNTVSQNEIMLFKIGSSDSGDEEINKQIRIIDEFGSRYRSLGGFIGDESKQLLSGVNAVEMSAGQTTLVSIDFPVIDARAEYFSLFSPDLVEGQGSWFWTDIRIKEGLFGWE
ncbi:MAG: hypothetical protein AAF434_12845 [Pseudomonadota bacterium]